MRCELINERHLARHAVIYIRQSTPNQVLTNQESLRLQYDLRRRACELGWREQDIEIIDADLGLSGAGSAHRAGFKDLIARVTLGQVGIVLSYEVTRLSRNCTDWYPLLDLCRFKDCLIADREGVYDPASANGRLLLGLKGTISEMELHTIRARLTAGLLNKAERGELSMMLPIGLVRDPTGVVLKNPDREVQSRIELLFETFLRVRSASKVMATFYAKNLTLPRRDRFGATCWRPPTISSIASMLKNPAYAGAFVYGRSAVTRCAPGAKGMPKPLPREQWKFIVKDKYPAYISWQTFDKIQATLRDNHAEYDRNKTRGVPRAGEALLHGIVYCGQCGHKMCVQYKGGSRYLCNTLRQQNGSPVCQFIPTRPIDREAVAAFFKALGPGELEALQRTLTRRSEADEASARSQRQQLERLRYRTSLAEHQFNQVDPNNRLVAAELEARWEASLRDLKQAEMVLSKSEEEHCADASVTVTEELRAAFADTASRLPKLWQGTRLDTAHKKALLRCLIDKVVLRREIADVIHMRIVWRGGDVTTLDIPVAVKAFASLSRAKEMEARIVKLARAGHTDEAIAKELTAAGFRSATRDQVIPSTVQYLRLRHGVMQVRSQSHPRRIPGSLTIPQLEVALGVTRHWLYDRIHSGTIALKRDARTGLYLFPDQSTTLSALRKLKAGELKRVSFDR